MSDFCPICFHPTEAAVCEHCAADLRLLRKMRSLESVAAPHALQETLQAYQQLHLPQAISRVLGKLAERALQVGEWRAARHHFEHILALDPSHTTPVFRTAIKRQLGALLGRTGELPLALHLLSVAQAAGDNLALIEKLRLELDTLSKRDAMTTIAELERLPTMPRRAKAWRLEALIRLGTLETDAELNAAVQDAEYAGDLYSEAITRRALGIWQANHHRHPAAHYNLQQAINLFRGDPYELARTQIDLARAYLLTEVSSTHGDATNTTIANARALLGAAVTTFRRLGTPLANQRASDLAQSLMIGRSAPRPKPDATSGSVGLVWVALHGVWDEKAWGHILETAQRQGAFAERMLGGVVVVLGQAQHQNDLDLIAETALALYELLSHHQVQFNVGKKTSFGIAAALGMLPEDEKNALKTLALLPHTPLFQETRAQAATLNGDIHLGAMLALGTRFATTPIEPPDAKDPAWYKLEPASGKGRKALKRWHLDDSAAIFTRLDPILDKAKGQGGFIAVVGAAGSGKTRLLECLADELESSTKAWLIHLRGRDAKTHQPFGAIRSWLGAELQQTSLSPRERRLTHIATFRRSVIGLLNSKPLLLVVDDAHLLDSGSLETLQAVLPLIATHRLMFLLGARTEEGAYTRLMDAAAQALPQASHRLHLSPHAQTLPRPLPDDALTRHVAASAAVLGDRFAGVVLRRMTQVAKLETHLGKLQEAGIIQLTEKKGVWMFQQTAERDALYVGLNPDYRAVLHWYARQALKELGLPNDEHVYPAGLSEPALKVSMRAAQMALETDSAPEALLHFDRALALADESASVSLLLARVGVLLSLEDWQAAAETLAKVDTLSGLSPRDRALILVYQGELHYRVGEYANLFHLYEQAAALIRDLPDADTGEHISILYAQALARFKRGELEMARSLTGGALHMASQAKLEGEMGHLWELLASIHQQRSEIQPALHAITRAINTYQRAGHSWQNVQPLRLLGGLLMEMGQLDDARKRLQEALDLAAAIGDRRAMMDLYYQLGVIANYRGEFGKLAQHHENALKVALFCAEENQKARAHARLAEGLTLQGKLIDAAQHATLSVQLAQGDAQAEAQLALARVSLALNCLDDADHAIQNATSALLASEESPLRLQVLLGALEVALVKEANEDFDKIWNTIREIPASPAHVFVRAQIGLLVGHSKAARQEWNNAAREFEQAAKAFTQLGAVYWRGKARAALKEIAPHAPGYSALRGNLRAGSDSVTPTPPSKVTRHLG